MRKLVGTIVVVVVILVAVVAIAINNLDAYLNDNKAWIVEQIEAALERPVDFDAVGVSFSRGLAVKVDGFRVGEDKSFGDGDFLNVGEAEVRVALWPALFGKIEVNRISFRDVSLVVIQTDAGLSTDSIGGAETPDGAESQADAQGESGPGAADSFTVALAEIRSVCGFWQKSCAQKIQADRM